MKLGEILFLIFLFFAWICYMADIKVLFLYLFLICCIVFLYSWKLNLFELYKKSFKKWLKTTWIFKNPIFISISKFMRSHDFFDAKEKVFERYYDGFYHYLINSWKTSFLYFMKKKFINIILFLKNIFSKKTTKKKLNLKSYIFYDYYNGMNAVWTYFHYLYFLCDLYYLSLVYFFIDLTFDYKQYYNFFMNLCAINLEENFSISNLYYSSIFHITMFRPISWWEKGYLIAYWKKKYWWFYDNFYDLKDFIEDFIEEDHFDPIRKFYVYIKPEFDVFFKHFKPYLKFYDANWHKKIKNLVFSFIKFFEAVIRYVLVFINFKIIKLIKNINKNLIFFFNSKIKPRNFVFKLILFIYKNFLKIKNFFCSIKYNLNSLESDCLNKMFYEDFVIKFNYEFFYNAYFWLLKKYDRFEGVDDESVFSRFNEVDLYLSEDELVNETLWEMNYHYSDYNCYEHWKYKVTFYDKIWEWPHFNLPQFVWDWSYLLKEEFYDFFQDYYKAKMRQFKKEDPVAFAKWKHREFLKYMEEGDGESPSPYFERHSSFQWDEDFYDFDFFLSYYGNIILLMHYTRILEKDWGYIKFSNKNAKFFNEKYQKNDNKKIDEEKIK